MNILLRNLSKNQWRAITLSILSLISIFAWIGASTVYDQYIYYNKVGWSDISHISYVLPLFNGEEWWYRYDVQTNSHGLITLREMGLPQPNIIAHLTYSNSCAFTGFITPLKVNQTVGLTYYPACGYLVVPKP